MDTKTLEYMEIRVVKAKNLVRRIDVISKAVDLIAVGNHFYDLSIMTEKDGSKDLLRRYEGTTDGSSGKAKKELYEILRPVLLNSFMDKRKKLQKELEEI